MNQALGKLSQVLFLSLIILAVAGCCTAAQSLYQEPGQGIHIPREAFQGVIREVVLWQGWALEEVHTVRMLDGEERVLIQRQTFPLLLDEGMQVQVALVPFPVDWQPGALYRWQIANSQGESVAEAPFELLDRAYESETLRMGRAATALVTTPNPERTAQSQRLNQVLGTTNGASLYHFGVLGDPLPQRQRESSPFGRRRVYIYENGRQENSRHWGQDLVAPRGTEILAGVSGQVALAEDRILSGGTVVIEFLPGIYQMFYHMDSILVAPGEWVSPLTPVGTLGATGFVTGPHLHWEIRAGGIALEPPPLLLRGILDKERIYGVISSDQE